MNINVMRIGLGLFWFVIGVGILFRSSLGLEHLEQRAGRDLTLFGYLGIGLAGWNVLRWWLSRQPSSKQSMEVIREQIAERRRRAERPEEYNPELDFTKQSTDRSKPSP